MRDFSYGPTNCNAFAGWVNLNNQIPFLYYSSDIDELLWIPSGVFLGCKIRVADFCSMQKFSITMQKFFKPIFWTFQKLLTSIVLKNNEFWQGWQKFLGCKKFFSPCKKFCMMLQKLLFAALISRATVLALEICTAIHFRLHTVT